MPNTSILYCHQWKERPMAVVVVVAEGWASVGDVALGVLVGDVFCVDEVKIAAAGQLTRKSAVGGAEGAMEQREQVLSSVQG